MPNPNPTHSHNRCYSGCRWMLLIYSGCCHPTRTHPCVVSVPAFKVPHPWLRPCLAFRHDLTAHQADQFRGTHTSWEQCSPPLVQLWKEMEYYVYVQTPKVQPKARLLDFHRPYFVRKYVKENLHFRTVQPHQKLCYKKYL